MRSDPLALPTVPPPAPADHPWRDRIVASLFVLALPVLALVDPLGKNAMLWENRAPAEWPALPPSGDFALRFEQAFNDHVRGRGLLLLMEHAVVAGVFRSSPVPTVMLGRDGWLYWLGEDGRSVDRNFRGTVAVQDAQLAAVAGELKRRSDFLAARGIAYVVTIVPEKFTVYPEFLPPWVARGSGPTPLTRLTTLLTGQGGVRHVDLVGPLHRARGSAQLYYRTDSHWNLLGATTGYEEIMREVQRALPPGLVASIAPAAHPAFVPGLDWTSGDLARLIGVPFLYREPDIAPLSKVLADAGARCAQRIDDGKDPELEVYSCSRSGLPRAVVYRDSMAIPLIPLLSENFSRAVYVSSRRLDPQLIERERPDVVIEEFVERTLLAPGISPM